MTLAEPGDGGLLEPGDGEPTVARQRAVRVSTTRLPGLTIALMASIGAGTIHAAAAGVHAEHPQLARLFVLCAVAQIAAGFDRLGLPEPAGRRNRSSRINAAAVAAWLATRITGISWIRASRCAKPRSSPIPRARCSAAAAVGCALAAADGRQAGFAHATPVVSGAGRRRADDPGDAQRRHPCAQPRLTPLHGSGVVDESQPHATRCGRHLGRRSRSADPASSAATGATVPVDESQPHSHAADGTSVAATQPTGRARGIRLKPIDVSGVPGVTPEQEARATKLIEESLKDLPKYADTAAAVADGYRSIGDAGTGSEHYIKLSLIEDNDFLDPTQPESLVYTVNGDSRTLAGAMYIASARPTDDPSLLAFAGPLMQWHNHGNLCWAIGPDGKPRVVGITDANGNCATGVNTGGENPMVHVWVTPHPCGVFAALEGVGAGQAAVPDDQRVDMCNQPHTHTAAAVADQAVRPDPADRPRRRPRRHARAAGRGREPRRRQRRPPAAVGRLQGRRGRRLPQHRRRRHRLRALHQVGLDQRRRRPRSRPPGEPRLPAAARRLEEAGQRDVHAARHRGARPTCPTSAAR